MAEEFCDNDSGPGDFAPVDEAMTAAFDCQCDLLGKIRDALAEGFNSAVDVLETISRKLAGSLAAGTIAPLGELSQLQAEIRTKTCAEMDGFCSFVLPLLDGLEARIEAVEGKPKPQPPPSPQVPPQPPPAEPPPADTTPQPPETDSTPQKPPGPSIAVASPEETGQFGRPLTADRPTPPIFQAGGIRQSGLVTQCRPDLYAAPGWAADFAGRAATAFQSPGGLTGLLGTAGNVAADNLGVGKIPFIGEAAEELLRGVGQLGDNLLTSVGNLVGCGPIALSLLGLESIPGALSQYLSPGFAEFGLPLTYARRLACPTQFPSVDEADAAWLANAVDTLTHKSWVQINNRCWEPHEAVIEAKRRKLLPAELLQLLLRKRITDQEFVDGLRAVGYTKESDWQALRDLGVVYPPYTDQIRLMMRDVYDKQRVQELGMHDLFDVKFLNEPRAIERAEALGIPVDLMRDLWAAHWALPASGQLFEMIHRLPFIGDDVIKMANEALAANKVSRTFSRPTQQEALNWATGILIQNDILPEVIPRLLGLSFRRMRLRDISRAFQIGAIDRAELKRQFQQQGFTDRDSDVQVEFWQKNTDEGADNDEAIKLFKAELITKDQAQERLSRRSYSPERLKEVLTDAEKTYRDSETVKRFRAGRIDYAVARQRLLAAGIDGSVASVLLDEAAELRDEHPALDRYEAGVIDRDEAIRKIGSDLTPPSRVKKLLDEIDLKLDAQLLKDCASNLCRRFDSGELAEHDLRRELNALGLSPSRQEWWIARCKCRKKSAGKEPSAAQLCAGFEQGLVSAQEFSSRLLRQGWSVPDAARIITSCTLRVEHKLAKAAEAEAKRIAKGAADQEKELARRQKAARADGEKLAKMRAAAAKAREQREARLVIVIDKLATQAGLPLADASRQVREAWRRLTADYPFTVTERIKILEIAVDKNLWTDGLPWDARWRAVAQAQLDVEGAEAGPRILQSEANGSQSP